MNKVILMGRLTKDPELRYSANGNNTAVCRFTLAVDRRFQKPGEDRKADVIPVVSFGKTGEFCSKYFKKGERVAIVGHLQSRSWEDNETRKHFALDVLVEEVDFADSKKEGSGTPTENTNNDGFYPLEDDDLPF